jgi:hypothetical protein
LWLASALFAFTIMPAALAAQEATPTVPEPPAFLLQPVGQGGAYFTITQDPGTTQEFTVALGNAGEEPVSALTYVADAYTLINGGFGVETADDPTSAPTTWINYPAETLALAPGETLERTFTVSIPDGTAPGQYIAGLAIQTAESIAVGESDAFRQIIKKAIAVFITVPGPETPAVTIGQASITQTATTNTLVVAVGNPGNVLLNPSGMVTMTTDEGAPVLTAPVTMGPVYAGTETTLEVSIPMILDPGVYSVTVALVDEETGASAEVTEVPVKVDVLPAAATPVAEPVSITSVTLDQLTNPDTDALQALNVGVTLENPGAAIPSARLTLHVTRDGELVEDYPLNSSLVVQAGATDIEQRYVPLSGWEPGTYRFALTLEAVNPTTGQLTVLATHSVAETIVVP